MATSKICKISGAALARWMISAALAVSAGGLTSSAAHAAPSGTITCLLYTYYSNAEETNQVGFFSTCPGGEKTGRKTRFFTVEKTTVSSPKPVNKPGGPGKLPCEFQKKGCPDFPAPR